MTFCASKSWDHFPGHGSVKISKFNVNADNRVCAIKHLQVCKRACVKSQFLNSMEMQTILRAHARTKQNSTCARANKQTSHPFFVSNLQMGIKSDLQSHMKFRMQDQLIAHMSRLHQHHSHNAEKHEISTPSPTCRCTSNQA